MKKINSKFYRILFRTLGMGIFGMTFCSCMMINAGGDNPKDNDSFNNPSSSLTQGDLFAGIKTQVDKFENENLVGDEALKCLRTIVDEVGKAENKFKTKVEVPFKNIKWELANEGGKINFKGGNNVIVRDVGRNLDNFRKYVQAVVNIRKLGGNCQIDFSASGFDKGIEGLLQIEELKGLSREYFINGITFTKKNLEFTFNDEVLLTNEEGLTKILKVWIFNSNLFVDDAMDNGLFLSSYNFIKKTFEPSLFGMDMWNNLGFDNFKGLAERFNFHSAFSWGGYIRIAGEMGINHLVIDPNPDFFISQCEGLRDFFDKHKVKHGIDITFTRNILEDDESGYFVSILLGLDRYTHIDFHFPDTGNKNIEILRGVQILVDLGVCNKPTLEIKDGDGQPFGTDHDNGVSIGGIVFSANTLKIYDKNKRRSVVNFTNAVLKLGDVTGEGISEEIKCEYSDDDTKIKLAGKDITIFS